MAENFYEWEERDEATPFFTHVIAGMEIYCLTPTFRLDSWRRGARWYVPTRHYKSKKYCYSNYFRRICKLPTANSTFGAHQKFYTETRALLASSEARKSLHLGVCQPMRAIFLCTNT